MVDELIAEGGRRILLPETLVVKNNKDGKPPTFFAGAFLQTTTNQTVVEVQVYSATFIMLKVYRKGSRGEPVEAKMQKTLDGAKAFLRTLV
jgi:hypothetical protein